MIEVTAAVIYSNGKFLICQRPKGKSCELLWEFPGGKIEPEETAKQCIVRECQEELGVTLRVLQKLTKGHICLPRPHDSFALFHNRNSFRRAYEKRT